MKMNTVYEDGGYFSKHPTWHEEDSSWKAKQIEKILKRNSIIPSTVCEIGCGAGEILNCLSNAYSPSVLFFGYEISPQAFAICKTKEKNNLHFFLANLLDSENESTFDIAMAIDVLEHIEDYYGFLRKFKKKAQFKVFHVPLDLSVQMILRNSPIMKVRTNLGHIHYFTKDIALSSLKDTGYQIIDYFYTSGSLELPNRGWKANLLKTPRKLAFFIHRDLTVRILGGFSFLVLAS